MGDIPFHDPRQRLDYEPQIGMVFEDTRESDRPEDERELLTLVYLDDHVALLRSSEKRRSSDFYRHRRPNRQKFEKQLGAGRLKPSDKDPPVPGGHVAAIERRAKELEEKDGRKSSHYAEALHEAVELLTRGRPEDDRRMVPFENCDGVGDRTAQRLRHNDIATYGDVRRASDERLLDVDGIGQQNLEAIREYVNDSK